MEERGSGGVITALTEATAIQTEVARRQPALEWGRIAFSQLLEVWSHVEDHETLAYEGKVGVQICVFQQASTHLWHL
jgi:hypothetical protein